MLYHILKSYIALGLNIFFKKIKVVNGENIPNKGPILFVANHQNALLDALLIATHNRRKTYFLTRADAFKTKIGRVFLTYLKMLPVYRIRDGFSSVNQNQEIFEDCFEILNKGYCLTIFPEGNHDLKRRLRPLSKGFTRIALGALDKYESLHLQIIPVGINYNNHQSFRGSVSLVFGKSIAVKDYFNGDFSADSLSLKNKVSGELQALIIHISDIEKYNQYMAYLNSINADLLNPLDVNLELNSLNESEIDSNEYFKPKEKSCSWLGNIVAVNNLLPLLLWNSFKSKIKDPVMIGTFKFTYGIFLFPMIYLIQSIGLALITNEWVATLYFIFCIISAPLLARRTFLKN